MQASLLEKAVTQDTKGTLHPVVSAAYDLNVKSSVELTKIAVDTNKALGFDLFDDLYYPRLVLDFSRVARAVAINALRNN